MDKVRVTRNYWIPSTQYPNGEVSVKGEVFSTYNTLKLKNDTLLAEWGEVNKGDIPKDCWEDGVYLHLPPIHSRSRMYSNSSRSIFTGVDRYVLCGNEETIYWVRLSVI